jgi:hypothetical protein
MSRKQLEKPATKAFPICWVACALHGSEASIRSAVGRYDNGGDWTTSVTSSDLVLSPAACYPVYPIVATRGPLAGRRFAVRHRSRRFRHELAQKTRSAAIVSHARFMRIGSPREILEFRESWMAKAPGSRTTSACPSPSTWRTTRSLAG